MPHHLSTLSMRHLFATERSIRLLRLVKAIPVLLLLIPLLCSWTNIGAQPPCASPPWAKVFRVQFEPHYSYLIPLTHGDPPNIRSRISIIPVNTPTQAASQLNSFSPPSSCQHSVITNLYYTTCTDWNGGCLENVRLKTLEETVELVDPLFYARRSIRGGCPPNSDQPEGVPYDPGPPILASDIAPYWNYVPGAQFYVIKIYTYVAPYSDTEYYETPTIYSSGASCASSPDEQEPPYCINIWDCLPVPLGNPVQYLTGEKFEKIIDYSAPVQAMAPVFGRRYSSHRLAMPEDTNIAAFDDCSTSEGLDLRSGLASQPGWDTFADIKLRRNGAERGFFRSIKLVLPPGPWPSNGREILFGLDGTINYCSPASEFNAHVINPQDAQVTLRKGFHAPSASGSALTSLPSWGQLLASEVEYTVTFQRECRLYFDALGRFLGVEDENGNGYAVHLSGTSSTYTHTQLVNGNHWTATISDSTVAGAQGPTRTVACSLNGGLFLEYKFKPLSASNIQDSPSKIEKVTFQIDPATAFVTEYSYTSAAGCFPEDAGSGCLDPLLPTDRPNQLLVSKKEGVVKNGNLSWQSRSAWSYKWLPSSTDSDDLRAVCTASRRYSGMEPDTTPMDEWRFYYGPDNETPAQWKWDGATRIIKQTLGGSASFSQEVIVDVATNRVLETHMPTKAAPKSSEYQWYDTSNAAWPHRSLGSTTVGLSEVESSVILDHRFMYYDPADPQASLPTAISSFRHKQQASTTLPASGAVLSTWVTLRNGGNLPDRFCPEVLPKTLIEYLPKETSPGVLNPLANLVGNITSPDGSFLDIEYSIIPSSLGLPVWIEESRAGNSLAPVTMAYDDPVRNPSTVKGLLTSMTTPRPSDAGNATLNTFFTYNQNGRLEKIEVQGALVEPVLFEYDEWGNVNKVTSVAPNDPTGVSTVSTDIVADAIGRTLSVVLDDAGDGDGQKAKYQATTTYLNAYLIDRVRGVDGRQADFRYNDIYQLTKSRSFQRDGQTTQSETEQSHNTAGLPVDTTGPDDRVYFSTAYQDGCSCLRATQELDGKGNHYLYDPDGAIRRIARRASWSSSWAGDTGGWQADIQPDGSAQSSLFESFVFNDFDQWGHIAKTNIQSATTGGASGDIETEYSYAAPVTTERNCDDVSTGTEFFPYNPNSEAASLRYGISSGESYMIGPLLRGIRQSLYVGTGKTQLSELRTFYDELSRPKGLRTSFTVPGGPSHSYDLNSTYFPDVSTVKTLDTPFGDYTYGFDSIARPVTTTVDLAKLARPTETPTIAAPANMALDVVYENKTGRVIRSTVAQPGTTGIRVYTKVDRQGRTTSLTYTTAEATPKALMHFDYEWGDLMIDPAATDRYIHKPEEHPSFIKSIKVWYGLNNPMAGFRASQPTSARVPAVSVNDGTATHNLAFYSAYTREFKYDDLGRLVREWRHDANPNLANRATLGEWTYGLDIVNNITDETIRLNGQAAAESRILNLFAPTPTPSVHNNLLGGITRSGAGRKPVTIPITGKFDVHAQTNNIDVKVRVYRLLGQTPEGSQIREYIGQPVEAGVGLLETDYEGNDSQYRRTAE
jgi:hypothetical protein